MANLLLSSSLLNWLWLIILGVILIAFFVVVLILLPVKAWFKGLTCGCKISIFKLIALKSRKANVATIVDAFICAKKAGIYIDIEELETHHMAGGDITGVVNALISAYNAKIEMSVDTAKALDLAGYNVFDVVKSSINPRVVETQVFNAVCKDGIELKARAKITIKGRISKTIGSAGEETIISRVVESVSSAISGSDSHKEVLQNLDFISNMVIAKNLDKGTCFDILSIDIVNVEIGKDIGSIFMMEQAKREQQLSTYKMEERKYKALCEEQELKAKAQKMQIAKIEAEAEVPKALAKAFEEGKINIMDYYKVQNIIADTNMRKSFALSNKKTNKDDDDDIDSFDLD
ncbi:MAG: flotillin-like FloA family protein [Clostridia bacterium]|nr:flotillin-like FloA family protein [Clostridia bacterium]